VTNDIFTKEDGEFLMRNDALPAERIRAVQTGGCPHAAIREDISVNIAPLEELTALFNTDFLLMESGGGARTARRSRFARALQAAFRRVMGWAAPSAHCRRARACVQRRGGRLPAARREATA